MSLFFEHNLAKTFQKIALQLEKHGESDYLLAYMSNQNPWICTSSPNESWDLKTNELGDPKEASYREAHPSTWRIIPFSKWLITVVSKSPK